MAEMREVASGLQFPEGPVALEDGSVLVVEIRRGTPIEHVPTGDPLTTNICFGGRDLRTAYITLSGTGRLVATEWPRPGLRLSWPR